MRAAPGLLVFAGLSLLAGHAHAARAANVVKKSIELKGAAAAAFAKLLELPAERSAHDFELSQSVELQAMPERDAALRDDRGLLSAELTWRPSALVRETATWDPASGVLRLDGYLTDLATGLPPRAGPRFMFASPGFEKAAVGKLPGWKPLYDKLVALPQKKLSASVSSRTLEVQLDGEQRAVATLLQTQTWNAQNQPVELWLITVAFGPVLPGPRE